jgi:hypothetical protein
VLNGKRSGEWCRLSERIDAGAQESDDGVDLLLELLGV